jgi:diguanylate cyclase (GGDEF)-like protein/PAS domain S-box-containing protein
MLLKSPIVRYAVLGVGFVALYLGLSRPDVIFLSHLGFTAWYPATGLALGLMLGVSPWFGIAVCIADSLSGLLTYHQPILSYGTTLAAIGGSACYAIAAYLLRGPIHIDLALLRRRDVVRYVLVTMSAAVVATPIGVLSLVADGSIHWDQFWPSALSWFFGDAVALLGIAPFLLIHIFPGVRAWVSASNPPSARLVESKSVLSNVADVAEALSQIAALLAVLWIMFGSVFGAKQLFYLSYVPIIWMAMRQGIQRAVTGLLLFNFGIVAALQLYPPVPGTLSKIGLLMLVVSAVGLIVGSAVTERHRMATDLQEQSTYLNSLIENNPLAIAILKQDGRVELANNAFEKLFLYDQAELQTEDLDVLLAPVDESSQSAQLSQQVFAGEALQVTVRRRRKDGQLLDLEMHAVPLAINGQVRRAFTIYKDVSEQLKAAETERKHAASLSHLVNELQLRTQQMTLLSEMGDMLECCHSHDEASTVVSDYVQKLFPEALSGTLYLFRSSRNALEAAARWGDASSSAKQFVADECWGLRRSQPHWSEPSSGKIACSHLKPASSIDRLCVPMVGQEHTLGVLHLDFSRDSEKDAAFSREEIREAQQQLATTLAGQVAFSLASLRLRETLRDQSIRDSLTGLFNRRFMEESLARELQRAARKNVPLSLLFLDLDKFKHFNDSFGHEAGDVVLRSVADLFVRFFRSDDVCCRYGGEEFAILLPESAPEYAAVRANALRAEIKRLSLQYKNQTLGTVSVSIGVSAFPEDGSTAEELLKVADRCLYQSKAAGRDTVTVASHQNA